MRKSTLAQISSVRGMYPQICWAIHVIILLFRKKAPFPNIRKKRSKIQNDNVKQNRQIIFNHLKGQYTKIELLNAPLFFAKGAKYFKAPLICPTFDTGASATSSFTF